MTYNETAALLGLVFGVLWALALQLVPGLAHKFETYSSERKSQILFGILAASAALIALGACTLESINLGVSCTQQGFEQIGIAFVIALTTGVISSQPTHNLAKHALPTIGVPGSPPAAP